MTNITLNGCIATDFLTTNQIADMKEAEATNKWWAEYRKNHKFSWEKTLEDDMEAQMDDEGTLL